MDTPAVTPVPKELVKELERGLERGSREKYQKGFTLLMEQKMKTNDKEWDDDLWGGWVTAAVEENEDPMKWRLNFTETEELEEYEAFYRWGQRGRREEEERVLEKGGCCMRLRTSLVQMLPPITETIG